MYIDRNYTKKALVLLPSELRKPIVAAMQEIVGAEIQQVYSRLRIVYDEIVYKINHTSQVTYMQDVLNNAIDPIERRIEIFNTLISSLVTVKLNDRIYEAPILLGEVILNDRSIYNIGDFDFQVVVPQLDELTNDELNRIVGYVQFYKLAGKRAKITKTRITN